MAWSLGAGAQQAAMPVIGFLSARLPDESAQHVRPGVARNDAGYIEGPSAYGRHPDRAGRVRAGIGSVLNIERSCGQRGGYAGWWFWLRSGQQRVSYPGRIRSGLQ
jgi:hypothetical protein